MLINDSLPPLSLQKLLENQKKQWLHFWLCLITVFYNEWYLIIRTGYISILILF